MSPTDAAPVSIRHTARFQLAVDVLGAAIALPTLIFLAGFFMPWVRLLAAGALGVSGLLVWKRISRARGWKPAAPTLSDVWLLAIALMLAFGSALLPGFGGAFNPTSDMPKHFLIFRELLGRAWPVCHEPHAAPSIDYPTYLRYSVGFYVLPALLGKIASVQNLTGILLVFMTGLYFCIYLASGYFVAGRKTPLWLALFALPVLALFGDLDTLYSLDKYGLKVFGEHNELGFRPWIEYFSVTSLMRWMPQHAIAAFYCALFYLGAMYVRRRSLVECVFAGAMVAGWSPLVTLSFAFLLSFYILLRRPPLLPEKDKPFWAALAVISVVLGIVLLLYYSADNGGIPRGIHWLPSFGEGLVVELGILFWLVRVLLPGEQYALSAAMLIALCLLPIVHLGISDDLGRYASAPLLMVMKLLILQHVLTLRFHPALRAAVVGVLLAICVLDGVNELYFTAEKEYASAMKSFDIDASLARQQVTSEHARQFLPQYYARCNPNSYILRCP